MLCFVFFMMANTCYQYNNIFVSLEEETLIEELPPIRLPCKYIYRLVTRLLIDVGGKRTHWWCNTKVGEPGMYKKGIKT